MNFASNFSDATIRRFLTARLSPKEQSEFEATLFSSSRLEQRVRLAEIELVDDYAADRLSRNECAAIRENFLVTTARHRQLEVSTAMANTLAESRTARLSNTVFVWPRLAWRIAFALLALVVFMAGAIVIRKEPQLVQRLIPRRPQPAAVPSRSPDAAHHPPDSSEPVHRDEAAPLPEHEASPQTIVLRANGSAENAPVVSVAHDGSAVVRLELMLERTETTTFSIVVATSSGEIVHNVPEMHVEAAERIDFDVLIERLRPGDFRVTLTRINDQPTTTTYYFRVQ